MKQTLLFILFSALLSGNFIAQEKGSLVPQSADIERHMFQNKQNGLDKYDGLEIIYLVKVEGIEKYPNEDIPKLSEKLASIDNFKSVEIENNSSKLIYITTTGNCNPDNLIKSLQEQGFRVLECTGEIQFIKK